MTRRFEVQIEQPCEERWDAMRPKATGRFCERCQRTVQDLSRLAPDQVQLIAMRASAGESICARVTRNAFGELILRAPGNRSDRRAAVLFSAALTVTLPAAAQEKTSSTQKPPAILTGTLRRPDGSMVASGLVQLTSRESGRSQLFVADEIGNFELHAAPGTYDLAVQTGSTQTKAITSVELHSGEQTVGEVLTRSGQSAGLTDPIYTTTGGALAATYRWGPRQILEHPILYTRSMLRRRS